MPSINKINVAGILYDVQDLEASTAIPQIKQMISNSESSPAAAAHAAGSYLIYNNTLCRASADIAVGDTLTVGTNIAAVSGGLAGDVADLKSAMNTNNVHGDVRFNIWDERWEKGIIDDSTGQDTGANGWRSVGYIPVMPSTEYYLKGSVARVLYYAADFSYISNVSSVANTTFTTPATARYIRIRSVTSGNPSYGNNVCINLSQPDTTISPHNGDYVPGNTINYVGQKVTKLQAEMLAVQDAIGADNADISLIRNAHSHPFIAGKYIKSDGTEGAGTSQGITDYIPFGATDKVMLRGIVTGSTVYAYAFYDADKTPITGSVGGNNFTGDIDIPSSAVTIPERTAYVRFSALTNGATPVVIVYNSQSLERDLASVRATLNGAMETVETVDNANARAYVTGAYLKQDGTEGPGLSYGVTDYIRFTTKDRAMLRGIETGSTVYAYAFYDSNKNFIANSSGGNNYTGEIDIPSASVTIPQNAAYVRFSAKTNGATPVAIVLDSQALESGINANADEIHGINTVIKKTPYVFNTSSSQLTRYPLTGYINNDTGAFVSNANYQCYYFDAHAADDVWFNDASSNTWLQIAVFDGTMFDTDDLVSIGSKGRNTLPVSGSEMHVSEGNKVVVCVYIGENFGLHYSEYALAGYVTESIGKSPIKIRPVSSTQFLVDVLSETSGQYLTHRFIRTVYTDTLEYGSGQSKSVVTEDIWYSDHIFDTAGNAIAQGNTNFIQSLDITGHKGHIGAGHGGVVEVWSLFFADGERFDPTTLDHEIECSKFRFQTKANHYLRDEANSPSSGHSYPSLDENGDPIIASVQYYDGEWSVNNRVTARNRLDVVLNQSFRFKQLHAGMCCGFYPYFDNVIVNNAEYIWNQFTKTGSNPDTFSAANMGGTSTVMPCPATSKLGASDEVILFGDNYRLSTRIYCLNPERYGKPNTMVQTPPYNPDNRIKGYLMPCVCTDSLIPSGQSAETFSAGDRFDVMVYRAIDMVI